MIRPVHKAALVLFVALLIGGLAVMAAACAPQSATPGTGASAGSTGAINSDGTGSGGGSAGGNAGEENPSGGTATPVNWSMKSECATCHTTEAAGAKDSKHVQAVAHAGLACVECHTNEAALAPVHKGVTTQSKPASKPTIITVDEKACVSCHGGLEAVAAKTAGSQALKDDRGAVVNPHLRPDGARHSENPATCTSCHNNHSETLARDAKKYCASCHHRGVWQCGTCHEQRD